MIAIPVKTNKENPAVTTLFGKAKWFAFINDEEVVIEKNTCESGREVVDNMVKKGVDKLIFSHMGGNPFLLLQKAGITCYYSGSERIELTNVVQKLRDGKLIKVDGSNMAEFVEQSNMHQMENRGEHNHHDEEHHHH